MGNENHNAGLVQPDYATKPVTALRDVGLNAISFVNKGANGKRFFLFKNEEGVGVEDGLTEFSPLFKSAEPTGTDWQYAYCVIAVPGEVDKQKDVWTEEEIEKASEEFLQSNAVLNFNHGSMASVGTLVGSMTAPADFTVTAPDGSTETIAKGTWYIKVRPNPEIKKMMDTGEISGMSVQGSARREEYHGEVEKSDKDNRAIPAGATGEGIKRVQHLLGLEETEVYDDQTEAALADYMAKKGVPGIPTLATLKLLLSEQPQSAPVEAAPVAPEAPVAPGGPGVAGAAPVEEAEKHVGEPYNPAKTNPVANGQHPNVQDGVNVGPAPGNLGLRAQDLSVESPADDLKAALGQSLQEGNESLEEYMAENYAGSQVGDLYGRNLSHAELWFMYSKFVGVGNKQTIDAQGNLVAAGDAAPQTAEKAVLSEAGEKPVTNEAPEKPVTNEAPEKPVTTEAPEEENKNGAALKRVAAILRAGGSPENVMAQISDSLKNKPVGMDGALPALKAAITQAAAAPEGEREALIEDIVEDFSRYLNHNTKKNALAKSFDSFSETHVTEDAPANPTNSPLGEDMDRAYIEENRDNLSAAAEFITSILAGQSSEAPEAPVAEVEKDAMEVKDEVPTEAPADAPKAPVATEGDVAEAAEEELADEGEDVTEDELVQVLNHVVETMDSFESRLSQLESLEKKLDQVGELAKALDVTGDIDVLRANVEEISKSLSAAASSEELDAIRKSVEDIASTPAAPSSLPVEAAPAPRAEVEEVVKSHTVPNDAASIWGGTFR